MISIRARQSLPLVLAAAMAVTSQAQELLWHKEEEGIDSAGHLAWSLATIEDLDHDGIADLVATTNRDCQIRSGVDGALIRRHDEQARTLWTLAVVGDVDRDFVEDYAYAVLNEGRVSVRSGKDGTEIFQKTGNSANQFGQSLAGGDVDGDGVADLLVGVSHHGSEDHGRVVVYSGATQDVIHRIAGNDADDRFGTSVAFVGDLNQDGFGDLLVGAPQDSARPGYAQVFSGRDKALLLHLVGASNGDSFGSECRPIHDHDGDRVPDFVVSSPAATLVQVFSGSDGRELLRLDGRGGLNVVSDMNGDGSPDLVLAVPGEAASLHCGASGRPLYTFRTVDFGIDPGERFASAVTGGDFDGDGFGDLVIATYLGGWNDHGTLTAFAGNDLYFQATPVAPAPLETLSLSVDGGLPHAPYAIFIETVDDVPFHRLLRLGRLDPRGHGGFSSTVPPAAAGVRIDLRSYSLDGRVTVSGIAAVEVQR